MQRADLCRIQGSGYTAVAASLKQLLKQHDIVSLIIDYQDAGIKNVGLGNHHGVPLSLPVLYIPMPHQAYS